MSPVMSNNSSSFFYKVITGNCKNIIIMHFSQYALMWKQYKTWDSSQPNPSRQLKSFFFFIKLKYTFFTQTGSLFNRQLAPSASNPVVRTADQQWIRVKFRHSVSCKSIHPTRHPVVFLCITAYKSVSFYTSTLVYLLKNTLQKC